MVHELQTGGNERMLNNNNDIYHTPLGVEYGLFENPLESTILMYLIGNNFMIDLFEQDLDNDSLEHYDDIQLHLLGHQYEAEYTNYFMAHLENATQKPDSDYFPLNTEHTHAVTTLVEVLTYTEALDTNINPLVIDNMYIPSYDISIHSIYQHIHKYKTNKIWFNNTYMEDQSTQCITEVQYIKKYKFLGIVRAVFDKTHTLNMRIINGADVSIMPTKFYDNTLFYITYHQNHIKIILVLVMLLLNTHKLVFIPLEIQGKGIQLRVLVCDSAAYTDIRS